MKTLIFILFLMSRPGYLVAAEADYYTKRGDVLDIKDALDKKMTAALRHSATLRQSAVDMPSSSCEVGELQENILEQLGGLGRSKIEFWLRDGEDQIVPGISSTQVPFDKSIYANTEQFSRFGSLACCEALGSYGGHIISGDKLGHFLESGFEMYLVAHKKEDFDRSNPWHITLNGMIDMVNSFKIPSRGKGVEAVIATGQFQENSNWGKTGTGVYSYSDMVANYEGYRFWSELTEGSNPYFRCENNRWKMVRPFSWAPYISDGWDEAINCNSYAKPEMAKIVDKQIEKVMLSKGTTEGVSCPLNPDKCRALFNRYKGELSALISPKCIEIAKQEGIQKSKELSGDSKKQGAQ